MSSLHQSYSMSDLSLATEAAEGERAVADDATSNEKKEPKEQLFTPDPKDRRDKEQKDMMTKKEK